MSSHYLRQWALLLVLTIAGFVGAQASVAPITPPNSAAAVACNFSISPEVHLFPSAGGEVTVNITVFGTPGDSCGWTTVDGYTWLSLSRVAGNGSGSLKVTVAANNTGAERIADIKIAGRDFTAFQAANCTYTVSPGTTQLSAQGGQANLTVTANSSACAWTAGESVSWITLTGKKSGPGSGLVPFSVTANNGPARSGTINISTATGTLAVTVNQTSGCSVTLGYTTRTVAANGANQSVPVTASNSACSWTATSNAPWITLANGGQQTGSVALLYTVAANNGPQRTGTITAGGRTLTVTQLSGCAYSLNPLGRHFNANGGSGALAVTASHAACPWTAVSNDPWIAITGGAVGQGTDTVVYTVAPNSGAARNGTATIAGKTFSISQEALATEAPILTSLNPAAAFAGGATFTLTVNGNNFSGASRVQWNGADRPTTFVSKTQLQAFIPAPDIAAEGSANVQVRDTAANLMSNSLKFIIFGAIANVSAASFNGEALAPDSIVSAFGAGLATQTALSNGLPLPTSLAGTTVTVRDSQGNEKLAELFFVSPNQINYLMPAGLAEGQAVVTVRNGAGQMRTGSTEIAKVAPGMFTADASGKGLASAVALRVRSNGQQEFETVAQFDSQQQKFVAAPIDLTVPGEQVYLILFGTGFRHRNSLEDVQVQVENLDVEPLYAGEAPGLLGMDQINLLLPKELAGSGEVDVTIKVDGKTANVIKLKFK